MTGRLPSGQLPSGMLPSGNPIPIRPSRQASSFPSVPSEPPFLPCSLRGPRRSAFFPASCNIFRHTDLQSVPPFRRKTSPRRISPAPRAQALLTYRAVLPYNSYIFRNFAPHFADVEHGGRNQAGVTCKEYTCRNPSANIQEN